MDGDGQLYLADFALGDRFRSPGHTLGEAHFLLFSGLTGDNHPIHYDEDYARQTRFGARVAYGLLVMAMSALGASPLAQRLETSMIAFLEQGCRFGIHSRKELTRASRFIEGNMNDLRRWWPRPWVLSR